MKPVTSSFKRAWSTVVLSASVGACTIGPSYVTPDAQLEPFHNSVPEMSAASTIALDAWWNGFNDQMLVEIVQRSLRENLDLAASIGRVQQARAFAAAAGAQLYPSADLHASAATTHQSQRNLLGTISKDAPDYERDINEYRVGPLASWEIDLFGGLKRHASAARDEAQAAEAERSGTRITVAADAADAYLQIRGYQARLEVAKQQVADDERLAHLVSDRYDLGNATGREVAQADALLNQARASIPSLAIGLEQQLNRLDVLLGVQPGTYSAQFLTVGEIPDVPAIANYGQTTEMLRRRPDVIAAERRLAASSELVGATLSEYYPKVSLQTALEFDSLSSEHLLTSQAFQTIGAGALRWRLFDFGRVDAEVAQAKGAQAVALAVYRQSILRAAEDVENALKTLAEIQVRTRDVQNQVIALMKARDLSEEAYRAGSITLTDVLDADRQLLIARDQLDSDRAGQARAAVALYRALGGGWTPPATGVLVVN